MKPIESKTYGITLNIGDLDDSYIIDGEYADKTYLSEKFDEFIENIKSELRFIGEYEFKEIICSLSEPQLGIYLDEKVNEKSTAYSVPGILDCKDKSMEEIKDAIDALIEKHPILKGRILDNDLPLLVCDTYPTIETVNEKDYMELIKPFDLNKNLTRFYIVNNDEGRFILYDMHHIISDASSRIIINNELEDILNGKIDNKTDLDLKKANSQNNTDLDLKINPENNKTDLGFVYASLNDFESKFKAEYELAHAAKVNQHFLKSKVDSKRTEIEEKTEKINKGYVKQNELIKKRKEIQAKISNLAKADPNNAQVKNVYNIYKYYLNLLDSINTEHRKAVTANELKRKERKINLMKSSTPLPVPK